MDKGAWPAMVHKLAESDMPEAIEYSSIEVKCLFFGLYFIISYYKILNINSCAIQQILVTYLL